MTKHTVSDQQASTSPRPGPTASSPPVDTSDVMDWEFVIETPPPRPSGTICANLTRGGRSRPLPLDEATRSMNGANETSGEKAR